MKPTQKFYIIGRLASGKSFFAKKLSEKTKIEHFDIDKIVFEDNTFNERLDEERNSLFKKITDTESWILEGTFTEDWVLDGLKKADKIIYLATPPHTRLWRFIKRTRREGFLRQQNLIGRTLLVLGFTYKEFDRTDATYKKVLTEFKEKTVILKTKKDTENFLR